MSNISPEKIEQVLKIVDAALLMHTRWYDDLIRTLLCKTPMDESYVAMDAHRKCSFGCWFYAQNDAGFHDLPSASKIEAMHKTMHDSAREICLKMKANGLVKEEDYDYFNRNLALFREELTNFRQRVLNTLESATAK